MSGRFPGAAALKLAPLLLGVLAACVLYEAAIAAGWIAIGRIPGAGPPGGTAVTIVATAAMLVAALVLAVSSAGVARFLPAAAALVMVARFFTYDPYYAPTLRRMSDGGVVSPLWLLAVAGAAALCALSRRLGPVGVVAIVVCAATFLAEPLGH